MSARLSIQSRRGTGMTDRRSQTPALLSVPSQRPHVKREDAKRGARATELELEADREQFIIPRGNGGSQADYARGKMEAERLRTQADALTLPVAEDGHMVRGGGEAVAVEPGSLNSNSGGSALAYIYDTLEHPASLSLEESEQRMRAAL